MLYASLDAVRTYVLSTEPHRMACEARDVIRRAGNDVEAIAARLRRIADKRGREAAESLRDEIKRQRSNQ